jgi:hypothetical protein
MPGLFEFDRLGHEINNVQPALDLVYDTHETCFSNRKGAKDTRVILFFTCFAACTSNLPHSQGGWFKSPDGRPSLDDHLQ